MTDDREARPMSAQTPDLVRSAAADLLALVYENLPKRFYDNDPKWRKVATAYVARMAGLVESMDRLVDLRHQPDASVLMRTLYEHLINFLWLGIDPPTRVELLFGHAERERLKLHKKLDAYGVPDLMTLDEVALAEQATRIPTIENRAEEVDRYWGPKIRGFYVNPADGPKHMLTFHGQYLGLYGVASRNAHGGVESLDNVAEYEHGRFVVTRQHEGDDLFSSVMALPLLAMALVVSHDLLGWPNADAVRAINDALVWQDENSRGLSSGSMPPPHYSS